MIKIYHKWKPAPLTVVFQESKTVYSPMVELIVSSSAHKLKYVIVTHRNSLEWFVQAFLKYKQYYGVPSVKLFHGRKCIIYVICWYSFMLHLKVFAPYPNPSTMWAILCSCSQSIMKCSVSLMLYMDSDILHNDMDIP